MAMLQKDYTTLKQSKRLLELGVPVKSANYKHPLVPACDGTCVLDLDMVVNCDYLCDGEIPLWSVGRLMEIFYIALIKHTDPKQKYMLVEMEFYGLIEQMIMRFEKEKDNLDFSKLELNN